MRRGMVEYNHDAENDQFIFKIISEERDDKGKLKPSKSVAIKLKDFKDEFIVGKLKRPAENEEDKTFQLDEWMKETVIEANPYNPEFGKDLQEYLETKNLQETPYNIPAFPMEISMKWDPDQGKISKYISGLDDEIIKMLHAVLDSDGRFEGLLMTVSNERYNRTRQVVEMERSNQSLKKK